MSDEISPKGQLNKTDWSKIAKGAGLAAAGAALAVVADALPGMNLGEYGPLVGALVAIALNVIRKLAVGPKDERRP